MRAVLAVPNALFVAMEVIALKVVLALVIKQMPYMMCNLWHL